MVSQIGRLPYLYFLLLSQSTLPTHSDWKTAVFILPSICAARNLAASRFGRLPYYYFLLLPTPQMFGLYDWNTAVLLLPSALRLSSMRHD